MSSDSIIAKSFQLATDKIRYMKIMALHPTLKVYWLIPLRKVTVLLFLFDESLNESYNHLKWIYYWDISILIILQSKFVAIGHATHQDIVNQFNDRMKQLDVNKLLQIYVDGPGLNDKFLEEVSKERKGGEQHQLINISNCGLLTIHGAFKTGAENAK